MQTGAKKLSNAFLASPHGERPLGGAAAPRPRRLAAMPPAAAPRRRRRAPPARGPAAGRRSPARPGSGAKLPRSCRAAGSELCAFSGSPSCPWAPSLARWGHRQPSQARGARLLGPGALRCRHRKDPRLNVEKHASVVLGTFVWKNNSNKNMVLFPSVERIAAAVLKL